MKRRWFLAGLGLAAANAGCLNIGRSASTKDAEGNDLNVARNSKTLVMATTANYPPYEQIKDAEGDREIVGFDIDLANLIADQLGRKLSIVDLEFGALIPALMNDEVDIAMAALEPNRSRKQKVDFSNIYYRARNALISLDGYLSAEDLNYQSIGIRANSVQARYADRLSAEAPDLDFVPYETLDEVFEALDIGAVEGAIVEANIAKTYLRRYPDFSGKIIPSKRPTGSAIALPKNSPLRAELNTALASITASGDMARLIEKWFA